MSYPSARKSNYGSQPKRTGVALRWGHKNKNSRKSLNNSFQNKIIQEPEVFKIGSVTSTVDLYLRNLGNINWTNFNLTTLTDNKNRAIALAFLAQKIKKPIELETQEKLADGKKQIAHFQMLRKDQTTQIALGSTFSSIINKELRNYVESLNSELSPLGYCIIKLE